MNFRISSDSPRTLGGRIINGEDAKIGEFPYQVSLQHIGIGHHCGGSILSKHWVITGAFCIRGNIWRDTKVIAGTINRKLPGSVHSIVKVVSHNNFDGFRHKGHNDIGLIKVQEPFEISETISYIPLLERNAEVANGALAIISGWGIEQGSSGHSVILQRTNVYIADLDYCNRTNSPVGIQIYDTQICALDFNGMTGPCEGDSGGPLTVDGELVGLASWIPECASREYPTVYTRVSKYIDWINAHVV